MASLAGKKALVTGASRGIGRAVARHIAAAGAEVAVHYGNSAQEAESLVAEITAAGGRAFAIGADIGSPEAIAELFAELDRRFARKGDAPYLDIVVANAGVGNAGSDNRFGKVSKGMFDAMFDINVRGAIFTMQEAAPRIVDGGRLVVTSSVVARMSHVMSPVYAASKAAVNSFVRSAAQGLGRRGITVNAIAPGAVDTDFIKHLRAVPGFDEGAAKNCWMGRLGTPDDIAGAVMMLLSDDAGWVTGQVIEANGGMAT